MKPYPFSLAAVLLAAGLAGALQAQPVSFAPAVSYETYLGGRAIATADLNGDGILDLAVVNDDSASVITLSILLGNGDGTFRPAMNTNTVFFPTALAIGDFNHDGKPDLAIAGRNVEILLGNGDGTFQAPVTVATGSSYTAVGAGDFNGDGNLDLAALVRGANSHGVVQILTGDGKGGFTLAHSYSTGGAYGTSLAVANLNGDRHPDLVVANFNSGTVSVLLGKGGGRFGAPTQFTTGINPYFVYAGDLRGNGTIDVVTTNLNSQNISVLLGNGNGTFQAAVTYAVQSEPYAIAGADFNGDGKLDLAVANASASSDSVSVLLGNGDGSFQAATNFKAGGQLPTSVAAGVFTTGGKADLAVANEGTSAVTVLLNTTP